MSSTNRRSVEMDDEEEQPMLHSPTKRRNKRGSGGSNGSSVIGDDGFPGGKFGEFLTKVLPFILKLEQGIEIIIVKSTPVIALLKKKYKVLYKNLEPYGPDEILTMLTGISMMFFGGFFITTVAVFEATSQGGRDNFVKNISLLGEQIKHVREANEEDDEKDEDGDGIADVKQISKSQLTRRKFMVFIRSCDPNVVSEALSHLYTILMTVTATLQVKFARTISLGSAIGNVLGKTVVKFVVPALKGVINEDLHKWVTPVALYLCRLIGISIAFAVQRVLSTVHTAFRGARLATEGFTIWCNKRGLNKYSDGWYDDAFAFFLAGIGIFGQLFIWNRLPFLIKLILFPLTFTEWILSFLVSASVSRGTATANQNEAFN